MSKEKRLDQTIFLHPLKNEPEAVRTSVVTGPYRVGFDQKSRPLKITPTSDTKVPRIAPYRGPKIVEFKVHEFLAVFPRPPADEDGEMVFARDSTYVDPQTGRLTEIGRIYHHLRKTYTLSGVHQLATFVSAVQAKVSAESWTEKFPGCRVFALGDCQRVRTTWVVPVALAPDVHVPKNRGKPRWRIVYLPVQSGQNLNGALYLTAALPSQQSYPQVAP